MNDIKIVVMPMGSDGCSHYRINKPYKELEKLGYNVVFIDKNAIETPEAFKSIEESDYIICRSYHHRAIKMLDELMNSESAIKEGRNKKLKVVVDIDDDIFDIDPYNESYGIFGVKEVKHGNEWLWKDGLNINIKENKESQDNVKEFLKRADIITVTTERLKDKMKQYNENVIVSPNAINIKDWVVPNFKQHSEIRIGWTGGASHYKDWFTVKDDIERIMKEYPRIKLCIAGAFFEGIFKNINKERVEFWDWVDATGHGYRTAMMDLDIAIIPLENTAFNSNKSCIKFYEFSSLKIPTICSNVAPYSDEAPKESLSNNFYESIKYLIENVDKAKELGERNYKWVMENRNQEKIIQ